MHLFDASSIVEALLIWRAESIPILGAGFRLELTMYEVGNSIRRIYAKRKPLNQEVTRKTRAATKVLGVMDVTPIVVEEIEKIMGIALDNSLTFYDAAYLYAARRDGLVLVTEDDPLRKIAEKLGCPVKRISEINTQ
jgi:predicted nucleic acid-binding protein